ncbi:MAG TPA: DUF4177 domain-containing protein [Anaerolineales bacterium]|nr:DUF4177 domain-containing protein [Anaerolineales bacterium]
MTEEYKFWEYRVQTVGSMWGTKDETLQTTLDEWGAEGWEVVNVFLSHGSGRVTIVAKRPLTERMRRIRSMPSQ